MHQDAAPADSFRVGLGEGLRRTLPVTLYVVPMGLAFGAAAIQGGLGAVWAVVMSALMCSGAAQFAALSVYSTVGLAVVPMLIAASTLNARHILLGAAIAPWLNRVGLGRRMAALAVLSEPNWALVLRMHDVEGVRDPARLAGVLAGGGLALWIAWLLGSSVGAFLGADLGDPSRFGLDLLVVAFFAALAAGFWRGPRQDLLPWAAAAVAAVVSQSLLPPGWHVLAGGLAGGLVGLALPAGPGRAADRDGATT